MELESRYRNVCLIILIIFSFALEEMDQWVGTDGSMQLIDTWEIVDKELSTCVIDLNAVE